MVVVARAVEAVGLGTVVVVVGPASSVRVSGEEVGFGVGGVVGLVELEAAWGAALEVEVGFGVGRVVGRAVLEGAWETALDMIERCTVKLAMEVFSSMSSMA